jgi:hypothetical protein
MNSSFHIAKKLGLRLVFIAGILVLSNAVYTHFFWRNDLYNEAEMLLELLEIQDSSDVLYFGESSNFSYNPHSDSLQDPISDFISYHYPELNFGTINSSAYHAGIFLPLIKQITSERVKTVIVTMNLRTFDQAAIHSELESALTKKTAMYEARPPLMNRLLMSLKYYDHTPAVERSRQLWEEWTYDTLVSDSFTFPAPTIKRWCELVKFPDSNGIENMPKRQLADHYIKAYAFLLDDDNPRVKDFDAIVSVAEEKGIKLVFSIMAENTEYADSLVGGNLVSLMRSNAEYLMERYTNANVRVVNNLELVPGSDYTDQDWTTEHYGQYGRQVLARNVAINIQDFLGGQYFRPQVIR